VIHCAGQRPTRNGSAVGGNPLPAPGSGTTEAADRQVTAGTASRQNEKMIGNTLSRSRGSIS